MRYSGNVLRVVVIGFVFQFASGRLATADELERQIEVGLELVRVGQPLPKSFADKVDLKILLGSVDKDPRAQFLLGKIYEWGDSSTPVDLSKAVELYEKSALAGYAPAQSALGDICRFRQSLGGTSAQALEWHLKAAAQDYSWSYAKLAEIYGRPSESVKTDREKKEMWMERALNSGCPLTIGSAKAQMAGEYFGGGGGRERNLETSLRLYKEAVNLESPKAMSTLGYYYAIGTVVPQNSGKAMDLFLGGATRGDAFAMGRLAESYLKGLGVAKDFGEAFRWYERAAAFGDADAMVSLSQLYIRGMGVKKDMKKGIEWLEKASDRSPRSRYDLAKRYENGTGGLAKNMEKALELYHSSAMSEKGHSLKSFPPAVDRLGILYLGTKSVPRDVAKALEWLEFSRNPRCKYELACLYRDGDGVELNRERAYELFKFAAMKNNKKAMVALAAAYRNGDGVEADPDEAEKWRKKSVKKAVTNKAKKSAQDKADKKANNKGKG